MLFAYPFVYLLQWLKWFHLFSIFWRDVMWNNIIRSVPIEIGNIQLWNLVTFAKIVWYYIQSFFVISHFTSGIICYRLLNGNKLTGPDKRHLYPIHLLSLAWCLSCLKGLATLDESGFSTLSFNLTCTTLICVACFSFSTHDWRMTFYLKEKKISNLTETWSLEEKRRTYWWLSSHREWWSEGALKSH